MSELAKITLKLVGLLLALCVTLGLAIAAYLDWQDTGSSDSAVFVAICVLFAVVASVLFLWQFTRLGEIPDQAPVEDKFPDYL